MHLVIVPVPEGKGEPAHEHADIRYVLSTADPESARPESDDAPMQWLTFDEAFALSAEDNLHETLRRVMELLADAQPPPSASLQPAPLASLDNRCCAHTAAALRRP